MLTLTLHRRSRVLVRHGRDADTLAIWLPCGEPGRLALRGPAYLLDGTPLVSIRYPDVAAGSVVELATRDGDRLVVHVWDVFPSKARLGFEEVPAAARPPGSFAFSVAREPWPGVARGTGEMRVTP